jgi:sodium transport system ATP-binding protein
MTDVLVEARNLTKEFRTRRGVVRAVDDVSFECRAGEVFGLLGPNGAGKTTTLRMLATILTPTSGSVTIAGFDTRKDPDRVRERIGFLATETGVYDRFTARETLRFFGRISGLTDAAVAKRAGEVFEMLAMTSLADRRVGTFSTGEKQKLSLARSIIHDPVVLILDEPTFGLDIMAARSVEETVALFREQGRTILLSTHVMRLAEKLCDRVAILYRGRIHASGTQAELRAVYGKADLEDVFFAAVGREAMA